MIGMFGSILLVVLGALCASNELSKYRASIQLALESISPFRGYLGLFAVGYGVLMTIELLFHIDLLRTFPFLFILELAASAVAVLVGILLGYDTAAEKIKERVPEALWTHIENLYVLLQKDRSTLGLLSIGLGMFHFLLSITPEPSVFLR